MKLTISKSESIFKDGSLGSEPTRKPLGCPRIDVFKNKSLAESKINNIENRLKDFA